MSKLPLRIYNGPERPKGYMQFPNPHTPLCVIFAPNPEGAARYASGFGAKSSTNCGMCPKESIFKHALKIRFRRDVRLIGDIFLILPALSDTFRQKIFNLSVYGAEIVFRPGGNGVVQFRGQAQGDLLFVFRHISTDFPSSRWAARPGSRTELLRDWRPWPPCAPHPVPQRLSRSDAPMPSPPCPPRRLRSFFWRL